MNHRDTPWMRGPFHTPLATHAFSAQIQIRTVAQHILSEKLALGD
jgi:ppGpp synthetase/RelA/SpoT-type nucleotidyltranferase